nr:MAG TPA: hypothetical protein [Caudoviricetes sp.]
MYKRCDILIEEKCQKLNVEIAFEPDIERQNTISKRR